MPQMINFWQKRRIIAVVVNANENIPRQLWVHPLNDERVEKEFYKLYPDLHHYSLKFFRMYQMNVGRFDYSLCKLEPML